MQQEYFFMVGIIRAKTSTRNTVAGHLAIGGADATAFGVGATLGLRSQGALRGPGLCDITPNGNAVNYFFP